MSESVRHLTKLHIAVPVLCLFGAFFFFTMTIFLIDFHIYQVVGSLITFISCILWIIARIQLGDAPMEGRFVTTGLYNELRHPIYYFQVTALAGVAIFLWIFELWFFVLALAVFQVLRIQREEKKLLDKFGRRYRNYKQRTIL